MANRTSAFSSSHPIHDLRYGLPLATVPESPMTQSCRFALVMATFRRRSSERNPTSRCEMAESKSEARVNFRSWMEQGGQTHLCVRSDEREDDSLAFLTLQEVYRADEKVRMVRLEKHRDLCHLSLVGGKDGDVGRRDSERDLQVGGNGSSAQSL